MTISKANKIRVRVEKVTEETAVGNGVAVGLVQGVIKLLDAYPALNRGQKVCRHFHFTGRSVGIFPPTVILGCLNLGEPRVLHTTFRSQPVDVLRILPGPGAAGLPRRDPLQVGCVVQRLFPAIDPAPAQCFDDHFVPGDAGDA